MRLDQRLVKDNYFNSREKAQNAIKVGAVMINNIIIKKSSYEVRDNDIISIGDNICPYVSRGGIKMKHALDTFMVNPKDKMILDIGSSTGGFCDCLLQHGASLIYAVDVGSMQLDSSLRLDSRIRLFENTNILDFKEDIKVDIITIDVSFVSITKILPSIKKFLKNETIIICLYKPQFEVGQKYLKNGIVKDQKVIITNILNFMEFVKSIGLYVNNMTYSPILGKEGNREFLAILSYNPKVSNIIPQELFKEI